MHFLKLIASAACLATASILNAQEPVFLSPDLFRLTKGSVNLRCLSGREKQPEEWTMAKVRWIFVKTGLVQENRDTLKDWLDPTGSLAVPIPAPGPVMIGIDFEPVIEEVTADSLKKRLSHETVVPSGKFKIRHYRSSLTLLRTDWPGRSATDSVIATTEVSLASSIHPLMDPTTFKLGGDMAIETVVQGEEIEDAKIYATNLTTGATTIMETTEGGMCRFSPDSAGQYHLYFQFARATKSDPEAAMEVFSTTLTFELRDPKEGGK